MALRVFRSGRAVKRRSASRSGIPDHQHLSQRVAEGERNAGPALATPMSQIVHSQLPRSPTAATGSGLAVTWMRWRWFVLDVLGMPVADWGRRWWLGSSVGPAAAHWSGSPTPTQR